ncbi:alpha/beta fold hydrolase [Ideonella sp. B508-1]|uniref:alpha/beta fold hydrolase n=1 Tax=Ideonella sp. B508-1 TaxID=137716 RepID=UPI0003B51634|nr:alpha/beta hydrolase [Ideonella sp. B508-1]
MPSSSPPEWFEWALSRACQSHFVETSGARIHYVGWNDHEVEKPALLFAHGFLGHARWWDFIAPFLADQFRVFALDFSGMGRSAARPAYPQGCFEDDLAAVMAAIRIDARPVTLVGHSFGGTRCLHVCLRQPEAVARAVVLDSFVRFEADRLPEITYRTPPRPTATPQETLARFRLLPPQACLAYTLDHIARHSVCEREGGWTWCFDPALREIESPGFEPLALSRLSVPVDYVHAQASAVVSAERALRIAEALPRCRGPVTMPHTGHHMMLDQPLALVSLLRALLAPSRGLATT